jgi:hypothetical protein
VANATGSAFFEPAMPCRNRPEKPVKRYFAAIRLSHELVKLAQPCPNSHALMA